MSRRETGERTPRSEMGAPSSRRLRSATPSKGRTAANAQTPSKTPKRELPSTPALPAATRRLAHTPSRPIAAKGKPEPSEPTMEVKRELISSQTPLKAPMAPPARPPKLDAPTPFKPIAALPPPTPTTPSRTLKDKTNVVQKTPVKSTPKKAAAPVPSSPARAVASPAPKPSSPPPSPKPTEAPPTPSPATPTKPKDNAPPVTEPEPAEPEVTEPTAEPGLSIPAEPIDPAPPVPMDPVPEPIPSPVKAAPEPEPVPTPAPTSPPKDAAPAPATEEQPEVSDVVTEEPETEEQPRGLGLMPQKRAEEEAVVLDDTSNTIDEDDVTLVEDKEPESTPTPEPTPTTILSQPVQTPAPPQATAPPIPSPAPRPGSEELESRLEAVQSVKDSGSEGDLRCRLCGAEEDQRHLLPHTLSHLLRKSHQCPRCPNRLANKNLLKHLRSAHPTKAQTLTAEFLKKNNAELLEMAETCFGIAVSACEDAELAKELSAVVSRLKEKKRHSSQYSCSFKSVCARVFDFEPSPESVNAHLLMHFTKQAFFHCAECKSDLRSSLHAHEGSRGSLSDLRHTFRESYLEVLRLSFPATPPPSAEPPRPTAQASTPGPSKASEKASPVTIASKLPTASQKTPSHAGQPRQRGSADAPIMVESEVAAPTPPAALGASFGPSGGGGVTPKTGKRRGDSNGPTPKRQQQPVTIVDSPKSSPQRQNTPMGSRLSGRAASSDDIEVVGVRSSSGGAKRNSSLNRSRSAASPAGPRVPPQFATLRQLSSQLLAATKASTTRSTVMQCGRCKEVLFVSDGVGKLEAHLISHMSGVVSLCEHCGKRFQPTDFAQHNKAVHQSQARHLNLSNNNDVVKNFIACFPEAADWEMVKGPAAPTRPASSASGGKTAATSPVAEAQSKGKRVQREMEEKFAARAQEFLDAESAFAKCPLKDCGATVKVTGPNLSAHVTYHSNKPLFVCLYKECSTNKVKDIELHVRLNHPSFTTYEDLRPQFMPYLLRLLDLCFPSVPATARKPKPVPELSPSQMMTPESFLSAPSSRRLSSPALSAGKRGGGVVESRKLEDILPPMPDFKAFFLTTQIRWKAYSEGKKLIQCYKCDSNGGLSTFMEDEAQLRLHIAEHLDRQMIKCPVCETRVNHLPYHFINVHPKVLPTPEGWARLDPLLVSFLNACLPPLGEEPKPELEALGGKRGAGLRRDKAIGTSTIFTRSLQTQTSQPLINANKRSIGVGGSVVPVGRSVDTQTMEAWTGRKGSGPASEPETRAELLLYKIEVLSLIEMRVKESRGSPDGKLYCRAHNCNFSFVYKSEISKVHTAAAYVESHILEKHLSQYLFECLICEKKIPNLQFHWSQYHDDMTMMPWFFTDSRRLHMKKLKAAVGVCFPFESHAETAALQAAAPPSTPVHRIPPPSPAIAAQLSQPRQLDGSPDNPVSIDEDVKPAIIAARKALPLKRPSGLDLAREAAAASKRARIIASGTEMRQAMQSTPLALRKRGRPNKGGTPMNRTPMAGTPMLPSRAVANGMTQSLASEMTPGPAAGAMRPLLTSTPATPGNPQRPIIPTPARTQAPPSAGHGTKLDPLTAKARRIYDQTLRGMETHIRTPGKPVIKCGIQTCRRSMGRAGGSKEETPMSRDQIEFHIAAHNSSGPLLYRCILCNSNVNIVDNHFENKHSGQQLRRGSNYLDLRPGNAKELLLQMRRCFPNVKIEPLEIVGPMPVAPGTAPTAKSPSVPNDPSPSESKAAAAPAPSETFKIPQLPQVAAPSPRGSVASALQSRPSVVAAVAAEASTSDAAAVEDARRSKVSILISPIDSATLSRHIQGPEPAEAPPRSNDVSQSDCTIVGDVSGVEGIGPSLESKVESMDAAADYGTPPPNWAPFPPPPYMDPNGFPFFPYGDAAPFPMGPPPFPFPQH